MSLNLSQRFNNLNIAEKLIAINVLCFAIPAFLRVFFFLFNSQGGDLFKYFNLPANLSQYINQPWSIITYSFLHGGFFHLLFNMLVLYYVGKMFIAYIGSKKFLSIYFMGVIAGGIAFMLTYNLFPVFRVVVGVSDLVGASAGVMAILIFMCGYVPKMRINFFFFNIPFYVLGIGLVIYDLLTIPLNNNAGGSIAHLGGAALGLYSVYQYKLGKSFGSSFEKLIDSIVNYFNFSSPRSKFRVNKNENYKTKKRHKKSKQSQESQEKIEKILKKISQSGYQSLSKDEKEFLFNKED
ncbi:MAG: rhomboid family intramembrane serine protease [Flavobacteriaceae bacterium]|nr:rhomboid family intramembrane serine protease [Flavobacteriaceae bacterium]MCY4266381.1 rhomboid family intramembrane serine protease [Flavobacteriaceae bacterium]